MYEIKIDFNENKIFAKRFKSSKTWFDFSPVETSGCNLLK